MTTNTIRFLELARKHSFTAVELDISKVQECIGKIGERAGMPYQAYGRVLKMMANFKDSIPFNKAVTHQFRVDAAEAGLKKSIEPDSMKVVITPRLN